MKTKSKHRWLALFMVVAMLIGTLPITVFAEDNTHTEDCYAKAGDLLCTIAESEGQKAEKTDLRSKANAGK